MRDSQQQSAAPGVNGVTDEFPSALKGVQNLVRAWGLRGGGGVDMACALATGTVQVARAVGLSRQTLERAMLEVWNRYEQAAKAKRAVATVKVNTKGGVS